MNDFTEYPFEFSVIMAVYNVEQYLREAVESLKRQNFGFSKIQVILVDDGSTDSSGSICDEIAQENPENVVVVHKENGGVSSARNEGLKIAQGKYVNFLDSDDKLSPNTLKAVHAFFSNHYDETDVVSIPMVFFGGQHGNHILNYKYEKGTRLIDLTKEYSCVQLSGSSSFIKKEAISSLTFDIRLAYAEDAKFVNTVLLRKQTLGVISSNAARYYYRRREGGEKSALQKSYDDLRWYVTSLDYFQGDLINICQTKVGIIPKFIQYAMAYDLQWRFSLPTLEHAKFIGVDIDEFQKKLHYVSTHIDDSIFLQQKSLVIENKLFALSVKYNKKPEAIYTGSDIILHYGDNCVFRISNSSFKVEFASIKNDFVVLEGYFVVPYFSFKEIYVEALVNDSVRLCKAIKRDEVKTSLGQEILSFYDFKLEFALNEVDDEYSIGFYTVIDNNRIRVNRISFGQFFPLNGKYRSAFYYCDGWKMVKNGRLISLTKCSIKQLQNYRKAFYKELWNNNGKGERKAVIGRMLVSFIRNHKKKPIWLISDRVSRAGDNGEAFFRYMRANHPEIDSYFVLDKNSPDYAEIKKVGPVIDSHSRLKKIMTMAADYVISSQAEVEIYNPFRGYSEPWRDLLADIRFIFLQHGVIKDDLSEWLKKGNKNIIGFVCSAKPEADSIINGNYRYDKEVWLTGLPRFDRLVNSPQKQIVFMPTWRQSLVGVWDMKTDSRTLKEGFEETDFFKFYNGLFNDQRLINAAREYGYSLFVMMHPNMLPFCDRFDHNDYVEWGDVTVPYSKLFSESSLLLTDYSSTAFDFAYLRKPIIYTQFDAEQFFSGEHVYTKGYFDYERDGFGEVEYDLDSTVNRIIEYMQGGCALKPEYRKRIDSFFAFDDKNNCKRVYEKIMELEDQD